MKRSWIKRSLGTASVVGKTAAGMVRGKVASLVGINDDDWQRRLVAGITEQLGQYKGLMLKIGQVASYMDLSLSEETRQILAKLQDSVPPMSHQELVAVFQSEFGRHPRKVFKNFELRPFAAASIGQVHRAEVPPGEPVAVKVQYADIVEAVQNDFRAVPMIVTTMMKPLFRGLDVDSVVKEVWTQLAAECDYLNEAKNQQAMRDFFSGDTEILIPTVYEEFTTIRVLTTSYVDGLRFEQFRQQATQEEKNKVGAVIVRFFLTSALKHGMFHGDPHPGNYLFLSDRVCFLDFGHVKTWESGQQEKLRALWLATLEGDRQGWRKAFFALHQPVFNKNYDDSFYFNFYRGALLAPYMAPHFKFSREFTQNYSRQIMFDQPLTSQVVPDKDIVIWMRQMFGLNAVLSLLECEGDFAGIARQLLR